MDFATLRFHKITLKKNMCTHNDTISLEENFLIASKLDMERDLQL